MSMFALSWNSYRHGGTCAPSWGAPGMLPDAPERTLVMHLELIPAQEAHGYAKIVVELVVF